MIVKNSWPTKKLGEVCDILDNLRKPITKQDRFSGPVPYYGATGVQDYVADFIFDEDLVLVGEDGARWGASNKSAYKISGKSWVNNHAHVLRPHRNVILDDWLTYFLYVSDLSEYITGTTVKKLNQAKLKSVEIPLPPLEVQKKIVAKLESLLAKISEAKKLRAQAQKNAKNLLSAELHKIFEEGKKKGWEKINFGDKKFVEIIDGDRGKNYPKKSDFIPKGYCLFLNTSNVRHGSFNFLKCDFISKERDEILRKGKLKRGDVILTTRGTVGNSAFFDDEVPFENIRINSGMVILRVNDKVLSQRFLLYILNSPNVIDLIKEANSGSAQPQLPIRVLSKISFILPPLTEQKKIVVRLDALSQKVDKVKKLQDTTENDFSALEQSILSQAFEGKIIT